MQPFDHQPELGPLRPKHEVLPNVIRRGTRLRLRRRALIAAPTAAASLALVLVVALLASSTSNQHVKTTPAGPPHTTTTTVLGLPSPNRTGPGGSLSPSGPGANQPAPGSTDSTNNADSTPPGDSASSPPPSGHVFGPCLPGGTQNNTGDPRACYEASSGPRGNYTSADPNARGCVVHNTGGYTVVTTPSDFFCQYDATKFGGYTSDGPFNLLRIVRNGQTIDIDGMDPKTPLCEPLGFIQPGDHVYIDGRNDFSTGVPTFPHAYTTTSVGDPFHC